jgi:NADPH:quinone reductase
MRRLRFREFGEPGAVLQLEEVRKPEITGLEVLIKVVASGINPSDAKNVIGHMEDTTLPRTPGRDFAGVIVEGPEKLIGKTVWGSGGDLGFVSDGAHSQFVVVPSDGFAIKPALLSDDEAATSALSFITAYLCYEAGSAVGDTSTVVVIGASGGVGNAAMLISRHFGKRTIGVVRSGSSAEQVKAAGFEVVSTDGADLSRSLKQLGIDGVDLVIDTVGGAMVDVAFKMLAQKGRIVEISAPPGAREIKLDALDFYHRQASLIGVDSRKFFTSECARILTKLEPLFQKNIDRVQQISRISLDEAIGAYSKIANGHTKERFSIHPNESE